MKRFFTKIASCKLARCFALFYCCKIRGYTLTVGKFWNFYLNAIVIRQHLWCRLGTFMIESFVIYVYVKVQIVSNVIRNQKILENHKHLQKHSFLLYNSNIIIFIHFLFYTQIAILFLRILIVSDTFKIF